MKTSNSNNDLKRPGLEEIESLFTSKGIPFTKQRRAILRFFQQRNKGATLAQAVESLKPKRIGRATVYRTIPILQDLGLVRVSLDREGNAYYFGVRLAHSHALICRSCRETVEFDTCDLSVLERLLKEQTGYRIEYHNLELVGICPKCDSNK
jgi:Fe2+ or Zn2+ uptake regulation protein